MPSSNMRGVIHQRPARANRDRAKRSTQGTNNLQGDSQIVLQPEGANMELG